MTEMMERMNQASSPEVPESRLFYIAGALAVGAIDVAGRAADKVGELLEQHTALIVSAMRDGSGANHGVVARVERSSGTEKVTVEDSITALGLRKDTVITVPISGFWAHKDVQAKRSSYTWGETDDVKEYSRDDRFGVRGGLSIVSIWRAARKARNAQRAQDARKRKEETFMQREWAQIVQNS